jgi:hypothetical protein
MIRDQEKIILDPSSKKGTGSRVQNTGSTGKLYPLKEDAGLLLAKP